MSNSSSNHYLFASLTIISLSLSFLQACNGSNSTTNSGNSNIPSEIESKKSNEHTENQVIPAVQRSQQVGRFIEKERSVAVGNGFACAIKKDQTVLCWGGNTIYQKDIPSNLKSIRQITVGTNNICALKEDGTPLCWGEQFGSIPVSLGAFRFLSAGQGFTCGIRAVDQLGYCWGGFINGVKSPINPNGSNDYKDKQPSDVPISTKRMTSISSGSDHVCALFEDKTVQCFGSDKYGLLDIPKDVVNVNMISAGFTHNLAMLEDGSIKVWGLRSDLSLKVPSALGTIGMISSGSDLSCVIRSDGSPWCWGYNHSVGYLQKQISLEKDSYLSISNSLLVDRACGIKTDGTVKCWGNGFTDSVPADLGVVFLQ